MGHTPETRATAYAKMRKRREKWLLENGPCKNGDCGSWVDLETHHRDPTQKVDHKVWSWSEQRMAAELAKCEPWCRECHKNHHALSHIRHGGLSRYQSGCRCSLCRAAKIVERKRYIAKKKLKSFPLEMVDKQITPQG